MATNVRRFRRIAMITGASLMLMTGPGVLAAQATEPIPATPPRCILAPLVVPPGGADFVGTLGDDVILGTSGPDRIFGSAGNDVICGGDGEDYIDGGGQNDTIYGEGHRDVLLGDTGDDDIYGGPNPPGGFREILDGGSGRDELFGESGPDVLSCGADFPDDADGGTGMGNGAAERDLIFDVAACSGMINVP